MEAVEFSRQIEEIEGIEEIELVQIELSPGDTLIVLAPVTLSDFSLGRLGKLFAKAFPNNRVLIAPQGIGFRVIREYDES